MLAEKNPHERDQYLVFDEEPHIYTVTTDTDSTYTSCTTFIHGFFGEFNADEIIKKMINSKNWPNSRYYGQTPEQIKQGWEENRIAASTAGTAMHKNIEDFYNGEKTLGDFQDLPDMQHFLTFYKEMGDKLRPYRSEWMIYDTDLKLAGSIDFVTENEDGSIHLWDWKRSREIKQENPWQRGLSPVENLPDTNFWHYSLQLNLYQALIEKNYKRQVNGLALVVMHPNNETYLYLPVPDLQDEIQKLFQYRFNQLRQPQSKANPNTKEEEDKNCSDTSSNEDVIPKGICLL